MEQPIVKVKNPRGPKVIPGFGLTMGVTMTMLSLVVLIPLASLFFSASKMNLSQFWQVITARDVLMAGKVSIECAFLAAIINSIFGVMLAWILVRYDFPGKRIVDGMIELPFALPTAVAGISLTALCSNQGLVGGLFAKVGIPIAYTKTGITIAMVFVGIPFVVRSVQPVLEKLDRTYEEAAGILGASKMRIFFRIIIPELFPAILAGFGLAFARGMGEYGSVVFIAGNIPYKTQIAPLIIMSKLEQYKYQEATAIALALLVLSFLIMLFVNLVQVALQRFGQGGSETGMDSLQKVIQAPGQQSDKRVRAGLILVSGLFLFLILFLPLITVVTYAMRDGWQAYVDAIIDEYTLSALGLTLSTTVIAVGVNTVFGMFASYLLSKYSFRGRGLMATLIDLPFSVSPVIAGLIFILTFGNIGWLGPILMQNGIKIVFAVPGVVIATIFVTVPFVFRELYPVLSAQGKDEEEAAALLGAGAFAIYRRITFPHIRWALLYGVVLCTARAMGEFGAVSVVSGHLRGETNTLPLHVEILYNEFNTTAAFAVSSILMILAIVLLVARSIVERRKRTA